MASPTSTAIVSKDQFSLRSFGTHFVPKDPRQMTYGKESLSVYPKILVDMPLSEKAHAFNVNRAAIEASSLNSLAKLQLMGSLHGADTIVNIIRNKWEYMALDSAKNRACMTITGFNTNTGTSIPDCLDPTTGLIKPVQTGTIPTCRPDGVTYVKVKVACDYAKIDKKNKASIEFATFLRLSTSRQTVNNSSGTARTLNTYDGVSDILGQSDDDFKKNIFGHTNSIKEPYDLDEVSFTGTAATPNKEKKKKDILEKVHEAVYGYILEAIFESICPNFLDDPERSFMNIRQTDPQSNTTLSVSQYYAVAMALLNNFRTGKDVNWSHDPAAHFVNNLDSPIRTKMEENKYTDHLGLAPTTPFDQICLMQKAYSHAILAENSINSSLELIDSRLNSVHGLQTTVLTSSAEKTISAYKPSYKPSDKFGCFGCGKTEHKWCEPGGKIIICPHKDEPGIRDHAEKQYQQMRKSRKDGRKRYRTANQESGDDRDKKKKNWQRNLVTALFQDKDSQELLKTLFSDANKGSSSGNKNVQCFRFYVLNSNSTRPILPIAIAPHSPHVILQLGKKGASFNPGLCLVLDTGSVITCGWAPFILDICKRFPQLVSGITYCNNEYQPIQLAGIVEPDKNDTQVIKACELKAVVEFFMPYETEEGVETTLKIAIGNDVSVNALIGLSFIQSAKIKMDFVDNVIESAVLNTDPIEIKFMKPGRHMPKNIESGQDADASTLTSSSSNVPIMASILTCTELFEKEAKYLAKKKSALKVATKVLAKTCPDFLAENTDSEGE